MLVLVLEPEINIRLWLKKIIAEMGYLVFSAATVEEAEFSIKKNGVPDVLVTERIVAAPPNLKFDGDLFASRLKNQFPSVLVLFQTAIGMVAYNDDYRHLIIFKPYKKSDFQEVFNELLGM